MVRIKDRIEFKISNLLSIVLPLNQPNKTIPSKIRNATQNFNYYLAVIYHFKIVGYLVNGY